MCRKTSWRHSENTAVLWKPRRKASKGTNPATTWRWTSSLQNCETLDFCGLSHRCAVNCESGLSRSVHDVQTKANSESHLRRHLLRRFLFSPSSYQCPSGAPLVHWALPSVQHLPWAPAEERGPLRSSLAARANLPWRLPARRSCVEITGVNTRSLSQENISWGKSTFGENIFERKQWNSYTTEHEL